MTSEPPGSRPEAGSERCFHCGAVLTAAADACAACSKPRALHASEERGHVAYLLHVLALAVEDRHLSEYAAERIAYPYKLRAGFQLPVRAARRPPAPAAPPPRPRVNPTVVWANALVYLGAFFVVITGILFLAVLGGPSRILLSIGVAVGFLVAGAVCRRFEIVRSAGTVFVGTGALLVPLIFVSLAAYLGGGGPLGPRGIWLVASLACVGLYTAMTLLGLGRFYAVLTLVATSNAFLALHSAARWEDRWYPTLFAAQALLLTALHEIGGAWLRRHFGLLVRIWGWSWTLPAIVGWVVVSIASTRGAPLPPLALLIAWAWLSQWRLPNPVLPAVAGALQIAFAVQVLRWLDAPTWSLGVAISLLAPVYVGAAYATLGRAGARGLNIVGMAAAVAGSNPLFFGAGHGFGIVSSLVATTVLVAAAVLPRRPLGLIPAAWTLGVGWYFVLTLFPVPDPTLDKIGAAYLPIVVFLAAATLALRIEWVWWRFTLAGILAFYAAGTLLLTLGHSGRLSAALAVATLAGAALAARWTSPWLVLAPCATATALVLSFLDWLHAPQASFGPSVLVLGLALWTAGIVVGRGVSLPLRLAGAVIAGVAFLVGFVSQVSHAGTGPNWSAHLDSLTLVAVALWVAWEARTRRVMLYPASLLLVTAGLWEMRALGVDSIQAYAVPLGLYFVAAGFAAGRDSHLPPGGGELATAAWTLAGLSFCVPTFGQTFGAQAIRYSIVLLVESFLLLLLSLGVGRRTLLATASTFVILAGLRMVVQNTDLILPAVISASCLFLSVGLGVLIYQGFKRRGASQTPGQ
jgi:hypothetical protein